MNASAFVPKGYVYRPGVPWQTCLTTDLQYIKTYSIIRNKGYFPQIGQECGKSRLVAGVERTHSTRYQCQRADAD